MDTIEKGSTLIEKVRRQQIVDTAIETIAQKGFSQTTLSDIAERAGVSTGVITYHFKNKADLIEQSIKKLLEAPNAYVISRLEGQLTYRDRLQTYIIANIDFMREHRSHSAALIYTFGSVGADQARHRIVVRQHAKIRKYLTKLLKLGQEAGEFGPFQAEALAQIVFSALEGIMLQWVLDEEGVDLSQCSDELIQIAERIVLPSS